VLAPRDTPTRERKSLDGLWRFALDPDGDDRARGWPGGLPAEAREVPVPASYNDLFPDPEVHGHVGDVWYEKAIRVPSGWAGGRIVLRFGAATHRATVWVESIANEPESVTKESRDYFAPLVELTGKLDASRPLAFANVQGADRTRT
jgi:beta-galactosidase/beta-glucuronidase